MAARSVRRADLMMVLAYATDLATGQSRDFALRSCVLAMRLAEALDLDTTQRRNVYHQAILRYTGCNADTHILATAFGDEIALRRDLALADLGSHSELGETFVRAFTRFFAHLPPEELESAVKQGLSEAIGVSVPILAAHCEVAQRIAERIGLPIFSTKGLEKRKEHGCKGASVFRDPLEEDRVWVMFDWDEAGFKNFVTDPAVPAILHEAGHVGKPQAAKLGGNYAA